MSHHILVSNISILLFVIILATSCNSWKGDNIGEYDYKGMYMTLKIRNETGDPIYVENDYRYGIGTALYKEQEKIYFCSTPVGFTRISYGEFYFNNRIEHSEEIEMQVQAVIPMNNARYRYELNDDATITTIYEGECDTVSFRFFYTKEPLRGHGIKNYNDEMVMRGYYAVGYQEEDKVIFIIRTYAKIDEDL